MSLDAPTCKSLHFPSHPRRKKKTPKRQKNKQKQKTVPFPTFPTLLSLCYLGNPAGPSCNLRITKLPVFWLLTYPGLRQSVYGSAGRAGSGCPQRCHCHCAVSLPLVGVSGSLGGCWLLVYFACSCSTCGPGMGDRPGLGVRILSVLPTEARSVAMPPKCLRSSFLYMILSKRLRGD